MATMPARDREGKAVEARMFDVEQDLALSLLQIGSPIMAQSRSLSHPVSHEAMSWKHLVRLHGVILQGTR